MRVGTRDALWATGLAIAITGLITWREVARERASASTRGSYR